MSLFIAYNDSEIARQLTQIDFILFNQIRPCELLNQAWAKTELRYMSPHVTALIDRVNQVSCWVASLILWSRTKEDRVKMVEKLLRICEELRALNNFGTLMAFISGLTMAPVDRLKYLSLFSFFHLFPQFSILKKKKKKEKLLLPSLLKHKRLFRNCKKF